MSKTRSQIYKIEFRSILKNPKYKFKITDDACGIPSIENEIFSISHHYDYYDKMMKYELFQRDGEL